MSGALKKKRSKKSIKLDRAKVNVGQDYELRYLRLRARKLKKLCTEWDYCEFSMKHDFIPDPVPFDVGTIKKIADCCIKLIDKELKK